MEENKRLSCKACGASAPQLNKHYIDWTCNCPPLDNTVKKENLLNGVVNMIDSYEHLSPSAMMTPLTHYDMLSVLLLLREALKLG